eukprot:855640-Pyramimonas_sp.AAC.1
MGRASEWADKVTRSVKKWDKAATTSQRGSGHPRRCAMIWSTRNPRGRLGGKSERRRGDA